MSSAASGHSGPSVGFNLGVIALLAAMGGLALAYGLDRAARVEAADGPAEDRLVTRSFGATTLTIPVTWFRNPNQPAEAFAKSVELVLTLPIGAEGAPEAIEIDLLPRSQVRPSAILLDGVYLHQFLPTELSGPPGLVGKPLGGSGGYAGETVWYDPLSANPFVAKCMDPLVADAPSRCLRAVFLGPGMAAIYGFDASALVGWRRFDAEIAARLERIGVK